MKKRLVVGILVVGAAIAAVTFFIFSDKDVEEVTEERVFIEQKVIGTSVEGRAITAHTYAPTTGEEQTHLVFVGGMHGGYEWNSVVLAYEIMDYFEEDEGRIPPGITVTVIPSLNPDGVYRVVNTEGRFIPLDAPQDEALTTPGRFNANGVDLNRNFDCKWKETGVWRGNSVSTGTGPFSEPETRALRDFVLEHKPDAVVFWHSQASAVYASECEEGVLPETLLLMNAYARVSGYTAVPSFDAYEVNGDAEGWLASIGIPALTVELSTHQTVEFEQNKAGVRALFDYYSSE